jgi:hypothetical protein
MKFFMQSLEELMNDSRWQVWMQTFPPELILY